MRSRTGLMIGALLALAPSAWACPGCKETLFDPEQLPQKLSLASGYATSIGLLLLVPVGLITALTVTIARSQRRHHLRQPEPGPH